MYMWSTNLWQRPNLNHKTSRRKEVVTTWHVLAMILCIWWQIILQKKQNETSDMTSNLKASAEQHHQHNEKATSE